VRGGVFQAPKLLHSHYVLLTSWFTAQQRYSICVPGASEGYPSTASDPAPKWRCGCSPGSLPWGECSAAAQLQAEETVLTVCTECSVSQQPSTKEGMRLLSRFTSLRRVQCRSSTASDGFRFFFHNVLNHDCSRQVVWEACVHMQTLRSCNVRFSCWKSVRTLFTYTHKGILLASPTYIAIGPVTGTWVCSISAATSTSMCDCAKDYYIYEQLRKILLHLWATAQKTTTSMSNCAKDYYIYEQLRKRLLQLWATAQKTITSMSNCAKDYYIYEQLRKRLLHLWATAQKTITPMSNCAKDYYTYEQLRKKILHVWATAQKTVTSMSNCAKDEQHVAVHTRCVSHWYASKKIMACKLITLIR